MKRPTIKQARTLSDSLGARAVIVLAFDNDNIAAASYGATKLECQQTGYTLDQIIERLQDGRIPVWQTAESIKLRSLRIKRQMIAEGEWCQGCDSPVSDCDCDDIFVGTETNEGSEY